MGFGVNYDEASAGLLPAGIYECLIDTAKKTVTQNGTPVIDVRMIIRNDVEKNQRKNARIYHSLWMRKEPTAADNACEGFSAKQIQSLSKAAGLPNGKAYESIDQWCEDLPGKLVLVTTEHETYKDKPRSKVRWVNETKHPECKHVRSQGPQDFVEADEDDGDVPF